MACLQETTARPSFFTDLDARVLGWLKWYNVRGKAPTAAVIAKRANCTERQAIGVLFHFRGPVIRHHDNETYELEPECEVTEWQLSPAELFSLWLEYGEPRPPEEAAKRKAAIQSYVVRMGSTVLENTGVIERGLEKLLASGRFTLRTDGMAKIEQRLQSWL